MPQSWEISNGIQLPAPRLQIDRRRCVFRKLEGVGQKAKWVLMEKIVLLIAATKKSDSLFRPDMF